MRHVPSSKEEENKALLSRYYYEASGWKLHIKESRAELERRSKLDEIYGVGI